MDHPLLQYDPPLFGDMTRGAALPAPRTWRTGVPLRLSDELELAAELLDAGTASERDRVFCRLVRRVRGAGDTPTCSALVRLLGPVTEHVLPAWRADPAHPQRRVASERGARL